MNEQMQETPFEPWPELRVAQAPTDRISAIVGGSTGPVTDWDSSAAVAFFGSISEVMRGVEAPELDIARIIIEGGNSTLEFLHLLSRIGSSCLADILWICESGSGFLSATGRGGDRILFALPPDQVRFYLEINALVTDRFSLDNGEPRANGCSESAAMRAEA